MEKQCGKISASMMCADMSKFKETIRIFEKNKIDYLHIDVMDGNFVPNFGIGTDYLRFLRQLTSIPMDIHLMVTQPDEKLEWLDIQPSDMVSIHYESTFNLQRTLDKLNFYDCRVMLAINPATPIYVVEEVHEYIDGVNLLTVNPGFAGQKIIERCIDKTKRLKDYFYERKYKNLLIEVDGNVSNENAFLLRAKGADVFVAGSSSIFHGDIEEMENKILQLKSVIR